MVTDTDPRKEYWKLLDVYEDFLSGGYARDHGDPPSFPEPVESSSGPESREEREAALAALAREVAACRNCRLCEKRTKAVPGTGVLDPLVMVIGEGPGEDEDRSGLPFVGKAGQYLDKWLEAIGLSRETNAFIANVVKCRPPQNRDPEPDETAACLPYLVRQVGLVRPAFILTVGRISTQTLTGKTSGIGSLRGNLFSFEGVTLVPTYHPSGVLRNQDLRRAVWDDLKILRNLIDGTASSGEA